MVDLEGGLQWEAAFSRKTIGRLICSLSMAYVVHLGIRVNFSGD